VVRSLDLETNEDIAKINAVIVGAFGCVALARKFPGWEVTPEQALLISEPLYEIGKKYPKVTDSILEASAPVSLAVSLAMIVGSRVVADKAYHDYMKAQATKAPAQAPTPEPQHVGAQTVWPGHSGPMPPQPEGAPSTGFPKDIAGLAELYANGQAVEV